MSKVSGGKHDGEVEVYMVERLKKNLEPYKHRRFLKHFYRGKMVIDTFTSSELARRMLNRRYPHGDARIVPAVISARGLLASGGEPRGAGS